MLLLSLRKRQLESRDENVRRRAAEKLGRSKDSRAIAPLVLMLLRYSFYDDGKIASSALAQIGEASVDALLQVLQGQYPLQEFIEETHDFSINNNIRHYALEALGRIGEKRAGETLLDYMRNRNADRSLRGKAGEALEQLNWKFSDEDRALKDVLNRNWEKAASLGEAAIEPLAADELYREHEKRMWAALLSTGSPLIPKVLARAQERHAATDLRMALDELVDPIAIPPSVLWEVIEHPASEGPCRESALVLLLKLRDKRAEEMVVDAHPKHAEMLCSVALKVTKSNPSVAEKALASMIERRILFPGTAYEAYCVVERASDSALVAKAAGALVRTLMISWKDGKGALPHQANQLRGMLARVLGNPVALPGIEEKDLLAISNLADVTYLDRAHAEDSRPDRYGRISQEENRRLAKEELTRRARAQGACPHCYRKGTITELSGKLWCSWCHDSV